MVLAPVAAEASNFNKSAIPAIIAQSTNNVEQNSIDQAWDLIRTARREANNGQTAQASESLLKAEQTARLLSNSATLEQLLAKIAAEQAKIGRYDRAIAITNSLSYTTMPPQACCVPVRTEAEIAIAEAYLKAGQINQAQQFAQKIQFAASRHQVLVPIVSYLADQGQFTQALTVSKQINDNFQAERARYGILKGYINAERFTEAVAFTKTVTDQNQKSILLTMLYQWARRSGKYDLSYQIANQITEPGAKAQALTEVAFAYSKAGQQQQALKILTQAYQIARSQKDFQFSAQWAGNFAQIGAFDRALSIVNSLKDYSQADARLAIARAYANAGQYAKAISMAQLIKDGQLQVVGDIPDPKVDTVNQIVRQAAKAGQYPLAIRAANSFDKGQHRVKALQIVADQYRISKQPQKAAAILDQAVAAARTVDKITIFYDRNTFFAVSNAGLLLDLARDYLKLNQRDRTIAVLDETLGSARTLKEKNLSSVREQVQYLQAIAKLYTQLQQRDQALAAAESAFNLVEQFPKDPQSAYYPSWKVQTLADVAQIFYIAQAPEQANKVLSSARTLNNTITDPQQQLWTQVAITQAYAVMDRQQEVMETVEAALKKAQNWEPHQRNWLRERLAVAAVLPDAGYALQLVQAIPDRAQRIPILAQIAVNYHKRGQHPQAQAVAVWIGQIAQTIPDDTQREQVLNDVIRNYYVPQGARDLDISRLLQAGQINAEIQSPNLKAYNWSLIAQAYTAQGEVGRAAETMNFALDIAKNISDRFERRDLMWQMFEDALRADNQSLAAQVANSFDQESYRTSALKQVRPIRN